MKLNNKGISIIEIVLTFSLIMIMVIGMIGIVFNYREKASVSLEKLDMHTFKNTITKDIQDDILEYGVKEINTNGECTNNTELNNCVNIVFKNGEEKIFGTSKIAVGTSDEEIKKSIENKFLYYDGLKYKLNDKLPSKKSSDREWTDFQMIKIQDSNILSTDSMVLENGNIVIMYAIDVYISHLDFDEDFGVHIVASSEIKSELASPSQPGGGGDDGNRYLRTEILKANPTIYDNPTLTAPFVSTNDASGLYKSTDTNDGKPTYYFRGNIANNYVSFANKTWRVLRINEDGTVRLIIESSIPHNSSLKFNTNDKEYKYSYYTNSNAVNSAKYILDDWFSTTIASNSLYLSKVVTGPYFCEQAKTKFIDSGTLGNAELILDDNYIANFKCEQDGNGYGKVNSNIGLISNDEFIHAGGYYSSYPKVDNIFYLYEKNGGWWHGIWTMTPEVFYSGTALVGCTNQGLITGDNANTAQPLYKHFRPVINLKSDVTVTGSGTIDNPWVVQ